MFQRLQEVDKMRAEHKRKQLEKDAADREAKEREVRELVVDLPYTNKLINAELLNLERIVKMFPHAI